MISRNLTKGKIVLSLVAEKINSSGILQNAITLSLAEDNILMQFASGEDFATVVNILKEINMFPKRGSVKSNRYFCIFDPETMLALLSIIDSRNKTFINQKPSSSYQEIRKGFNPESISNNEVMPPILTLPQEIICQIMEHLTYRDAFNLAFSLVLSYVKYFEEYHSQKGKTEKNLLFKQAASYYEALFTTAKKRPRPPLLVRGFSYISGQGSFGWGNNERGEIGFGQIRKQATPQLINELKDKVIVAVVGDEYRKVVLTNTGEVYFWGDPLIEGGCRTFNPELIKFDGKKVTAIAMGSNHIIALSETGEVYSWGRNIHGQLGLGIKMWTSQATVWDYEDRTTPQRIKFDGKKIIAIAAGYCHTIVLTETGEVYSWGSNDHGQVGLNDLRDSAKPQLIGFDGKKVTAIAAGGNHTIALTETGEVYSFLWYPKRIDGFDRKVTAIAAGYNHVIALTEAGKVYSWGENYQGQLGRLDPYVCSPVITLNSAKIIAIRAIGNNSFATSNTGEIYVWGENLNLGEDEKDQKLPTKFTFPQLPIAQKEWLEESTYTPKK